MTRIEKEFFTVVKRHLPSATKVDLNIKERNLYIFFSTEKNEFDVTDTKVVRLLQIYSLMGDEHFDEFLYDVETLYKLFSLPGEPKDLDVKFLFV